jgi:hypothetical protein
MLSAGSIIEGAFRLIREHPAAVAVWGLLYLLAAIAMSFAMQPVVEAQMASLGGDPQRAVAGMAAMVGRIFLLQSAFFVLFVVLMTAAQRAVLRPAEKGFFYLRLGMDELRMIGLSLILVIAVYFGFVIVAILAALAVFAVAAALGSVAALVAGLILGFGLLGALIWLEVRLSLAFPLTLVRRRIILGESWRLTKGRFWTLFGAYLVIFLVILAVSIALSLVTTGSYFAELIRNAGNPEAMRHAMEAQMDRQFGQVTAMTVAGWVLGAVAGAITIALMGGATATATRVLIGEESVADTFA